MAKQETFRDIALSSPRKDQELWRWLYTELRAAILDGTPQTRSKAAIDSQRGEAVQPLQGHSCCGLRAASVGGLHALSDECRNVCCGRSSCPAFVSLASSVFQSNDLSGDRIQANGGADEGQSDDPFGPECSWTGLSEL